MLDGHYKRYYSSTEAPIGGRRHHWRLRNERQRLDHEPKALKVSRFTFALSKVPLSLAKIPSAHRPSALFALKYPVALVSSRKTVPLAEQTLLHLNRGYLLALALMLPLKGWLVERIGAKSLYLWCFSAFTLSSALCGTAWSVNALIGFRILQGMSGGLMAPMAQLMMARVAGKHFARIIGYAAAPIMLGPTLGPVIAGAILQHASWRWDKAAEHAPAGEPPAILEMMTE